MSASVLRFNNRSTRRPGAQTKIDASALEAPQSGSVGRVMLIGSAKGGVPYSELAAEDVERFTSGDAMARAFRSGDLLQAGNFAFAPAKDPGVAGAETVIALKVDPDTQSSATLANANGDAIVLTSLDYGLHTRQISISIDDGSDQGKLVSVSFEGETQSKDNIGGENLATLQYREPTGLGWDVVQMLITTSGIQASASRSELGRSDELANAAINDTIQVVSSSASDVGQVVTCYVVIGSTPTAVELTLNGTSAVTNASAIAANGFYGAELSAACVGTVTVRNTTGPVILVQFTAGQLARGGVQGVGMFVDSDVVAQVADGASTANVFFVGLDATGTQVLELRALAGAVSVDTVTTNWSQLDFVGLARVAAARTITFSAVAAETDHDVQDDLIKVRDYFNARQVVYASAVRGFTFTILTTRTSFDPATLDVTPSASPIDAYYPASAGLLADLQLIIEYLNDESVFISAAAASGAEGGAPSNTATPIYLSGGSAGTASFDDWQGALDLARFIECDTVVVLTADDAVHAALSDHLDFMAGKGKYERDAVVGVMNAGLTALASRTEIKQQIAALNNRNISVVAQSIDRYDLDGERETFDPMFLAAIVAGAQAGTQLGRSLDLKAMNVLTFAQDSSWNPTDNDEEMLEAGLVFLENAGTLGRRIVRHITSAVGSSNRAFTAASTNRVLNFVARDLRTDLELFVGEPGEAKTRAAIAGRARKKLTSYVKDERILREFQPPQVTIQSDQAIVGISVSIAESIVFVPITINLYDAAVTG